MSNTTKHDIILSNRLVVGHLQLVRSVTLLEVKMSDDAGEEHVVVETQQNEQTQTTSSSTGSDEPMVPEVDLTGLTHAKRKEAIEILCMEADSFLKDDEDI